MDPHYFIDNFELEQNEEDLDLQEFTNYLPDGSWEIYPDDYKIVYNKKLYTKVTFDNRTKIISFYESDKINLQYKLILKKI